MFVFFGSCQFKGSILACMSPNFQSELAHISHELSQAEKTPAPDESKLSRAELSLDASLQVMLYQSDLIYIGLML